MAEVHVIGQLTSGHGFTHRRLACRWQLSFGDHWQAIEGATEGLTQLDSPQIGSTAFFSHPIDVHFITSGLQGWPKFEIEVWQQDAYRRSAPCAYGVAHLPSTPGHHKIEITTWRPIGSSSEEVSFFFTGGGLRLESTSILSESQERFRLQTESSGTITFDLFIITRNFERFGIESL